MLTILRTIGSFWRLQL